MYRVISTYNSKSHFLLNSPMHWQKQAAMTCDAGSRSAGHVVSNDFSDWLTSLVSAERGLQSRKRERVWRIIWQWMRLFFTREESGRIQRGFTRQRLLGLLQMILLAWHYFIGLCRTSDSTSASIISEI